MLTHKPQKIPNKVENYTACVLKRQKCSKTSEMGAFKPRSVIQDLDKAEDAQVPRLGTNMDTTLKKKKERKSNISLSLYAIVINNYSYLFLYAVDG